MFRYVPLMIKNALRNRRRSILTVCSIGASLCLLGLLMAIYHAFFFSAPSDEQARRLVVRNRVSLTNPLPISYGQKIRQVPGVEEVVVAQWFGGVYKEPQNFFARFAVEPEKFFRVTPEYKISEEEKRAFIQERTATVIGRDIANKHNLKIGDRMTLVGDIFNVTMEFTIRGIYDYPPENETMLFHLDYLFESLPAGQRDFAGTFTILMDSPQSAARISNAIDEMFRNSPQQTKTETEKAFALSFLSFLGDVKMILISICAALTFTIILVTANTMAMSVRERIREVGVLKTLGFSNGAILGMILGEAAVLSLMGGAVGYLIASGLTAVVRSGPNLGPELKTLAIQPSVAVLLLGIAVGIGVLSSLIPAWNAARTNILDSLRYSG